MITSTISVEAAAVVSLESWNRKRHGRIWSTVSATSDQLASSARRVNASVPRRAIEDISSMRGSATSATSASISERLGSENDSDDRSRSAGD